MPTRDFTDEDHRIIREIRESPEHARLFFEEHRAELVRLVRLRMDQRLNRRLDPSDVVHEAFVRYQPALERYLKSAAKPPLVWLRFFVRKVLSRLTQKHFDSQCRDIQREAKVELDVDILADSVSSIGKEIHKAELRSRLKELFASMSNTDREILALMHLEGKTISEASDELEINVDAAKKRYRRAVNKLSASSKVAELQVFHR